MSNLYHKIKTNHDWQMLLEASETQVVALFKHSSTCPISAAAWQRVLPLLEQQTFCVPLWQLIVQENPDLKLQIAQELDVVHESPQLIAVSKREAVYVMNHHDIAVTEFCRQCSLALQAVV